MLAISLAIKLLLKTNFACPAPAILPESRFLFSFNVVTILKGFIRVLSLLLLMASIVFNTFESESSIIIIDRDVERFTIFRSFKSIGLPFLQMIFSFLDNFTFSLMFLPSRLYPLEPLSLFYVTSGSQQLHLMP